MKNLFSLILLIPMLFLPVGAEEIDLGARIDGINKRLRDALLDVEEMKTINEGSIKEYKSILRSMLKDEKELSDKRVKVSNLDLLRQNIDEVKREIEKLEFEIDKKKNTVGVIEKEKNELLSKNGLKDGVCDLHGKKMEKTTIFIRVGFRLHTYPANDYLAGRLPLFPNSDEPIEGGCSPPFANSIEWMTCPSCNAARKKWLLEKSRPLPK